MARIAIALLLLARSAAGAWRRVADLPFALSDFTATLVPNRGRIVIVGGCDEDQSRITWAVIFAVIVRARADIN